MRSAHIEPMHPGGLLGDLIEDNGLTKKNAAERLGISRQHVHDIVAGRKPISADVAVKLAALFGGKAAIWTRMQSSFDTWHAEREVDVSRIVPLPRAA